MLGQAIEINPQNIQARTRLGTLIHLFGSSALSSMAGQDQLKWLQALKLDSTNANLFYCIAVFTFLRKGDATKALQCLEKALSYKPNFGEAFFMQCFILTSQGHHQKTATLIQSFESSQNRNLPFTYFFKGLREFMVKNYVQAIEEFQNADKF